MRKTNVFWHWFEKFGFLTYIWVYELLLGLPAIASESFLFIDIDLTIFPICGYSHALSCNISISSFTQPWALHKIRRCCNLDLAIYHLYMTCAIYDVSSLLISNLLLPVLIICIMLTQMYFICLPMANI